MMKKFINDPQTVTDEELEGLGLAFSDTVIVDGHLIISKDLENADRVTVVTYGGSGQEPGRWRHLCRTERTARLRSFEACRQGTRCLVADTQLCR